MVIKQCRNDGKKSVDEQAECEIKWGQKLQEQGYGGHKNLAPVRDAFRSATHRHFVMAEVTKPTAEEYAHAGLRCDPDRLANAELFELVNGAQFLSAAELADPDYDGPCKGDIQCVVARLALQMLSGMQALHDGVKPHTPKPKRQDSEEPSTSAGSSSADFQGLASAVLFDDSSASGDASAG